MLSTSLRRQALVASYELNDANYEVKWCTRSMLCVELFRWLNRMHKGMSRVKVEVDKIKLSEVLTACSWGSESEHSRLTK